MGQYTRFRGDPESKLFYLLNGFSGGINTEFSDDASPDVDFANIVNLDVDRLGTLNKRNGFGELKALTNLFNMFVPSGDLPGMFLRKETFSEANYNSETPVYIKLLRNDNNCFNNIEEFNGEHGYREYQRRYGFQNNKFELMIITSFPLYNLEAGHITDSKSRVYYYSCTFPTLGKGPLGEDVDTIDFKYTNIELPILFNWNKTLTNMPSVEFYDKIWFTTNGEGLVWFDRNAVINDGLDLCNAFHFTTDKDELTNENAIDGPIPFTWYNEAYRPSLVELTEASFGPNALCKNPLIDLKVNTDVVESLQGAFLTTLDGKPLHKTIPAGENLLLYVLYTGSSTFEISAKNGETTLGLTATERNDLSLEGLKVFQLDFHTTPNGEVEIKIEKLGVEVVKPYYFYVTTGQLDPNLSTIEYLNIGTCGMCMMSDNRVAYYRDDVIFFSDINIPNYITYNNYLKLPLEPTDSIVKICFFKSVYIVFTKQKIYKLVGNWGTSEFACEPVSESLGCIAGNTVVPIDDMLYFMSPRGLYALKSSTFVESMQNLKEIDLKVKRLTTDFTRYDNKLEGLTMRYNPISETAYAIRYRDKYMLFYNNYDDTASYATEKGIDVLVYQYDIGTFTTYKFKYKPRFIAQINGKLNVFAYVPLYDDVVKFKVCEFGVSSTDFDEPIYIELETKGINMKYPQHLKKLKNIFIKMIGGYKYNEFFFELYGDGYLVNDPKKYSVRIDSDGTVVYDYEEEKLIKVDELTAIYGNFRLGHTRLGDGTYQTKKLVIPRKANNFTCKIYGETEDYISFESFGFVCKLGKVKES